jgi:hypothetical protein
MNRYAGHPSSNTVRTGDLLVAPCLTDATELAAELGRIFSMSSHSGECQGPSAMKMHNSLFTQ